VADTPVVTFLAAALLQFTHYLVLTVNFRAIAHKRWRWAIVTDAAAVMFSYFIVQQVANAEGYTVLAGMMLGGSAAAVAGIKLTEGWS